MMYPKHRKRVTSLDGDVSEASKTGFGGGSGKIEEKAEMYPDLHKSGRGRGGS